MSAVPLLALARDWPAAALLIILERIGKAIRNPPRDVMLSHAAKEMDTAGALAFMRHWIRSAPYSVRFW